MTAPGWTLPSGERRGDALSPEARTALQDLTRIWQTSANDALSRALLLAAPAVRAEEEQGAGGGPA